MTHLSANTPAKGDSIKRAILKPEGDDRNRAPKARCRFKNTRRTLREWRGSEGGQKESRQREKKTDKVDNVRMRMKVGVQGEKKEE
jgi:hypothetical protein